MTKNFPVFARITGISFLFAAIPSGMLFLSGNAHTMYYFTAIFAATCAGCFVLTQLYFIPKLNSILDKLKKHRGEKSGSEQRTFPTVFEEIDAGIEGWADDKRAETEQMNRLENYRKEFLGNVSHEIKTPVFNIQGYLHTLLDGGLEDNTINKKYLTRAAQSVERMISIVQDLETISLLESEGLDLEPEKFDIVALSKDIVEAQELKANEKNIVLTMKNNPNDQIFVFADRQRIRQVLTNLITNSIRYGKEGGETKIKISDVVDKILVEVADNGIGIPEKHVPRIFERFYRADKSRSRELGGTGLGLAIVKHILEAHRHSIQVISTEGVGSVFTFSLSKFG